jgi:hypothetical protein
MVPQSGVPEIKSSLPSWSTMMALPLYCQVQWLEQTGFSFNKDIAIAVA